MKMKTVPVLLLVSGLIATAPLWAQSNSTGEATVGTPVEGARGITERVSDIMVRAREVDARPNRGLRMKYEFENEYRHPTNPDSSPAVSQWPPATDSAAGPPTVDAAQTVSTPNFTGATLTDTGAFPPDTMGAVGPTQFIVGVNGRVRTFNKLTGVADGAINADTDAFFASVMTPGTNFTSDPRVRYDRLTGRWFLIIIDVPGGVGDQANRVMLAVSDGATITSISNFTFYQFQMSGTLFADYPTLGIDANALYIGANMFTLAGSFSSTLGSVVRKTSVLSGGPIVQSTFALVATSSGAGPYTPQGVDNFDVAATEGYFVGVDNATFGTVMIRRVSTPGAVPTLSGNLSVAVPTTSFPVPVPHSGNTGGNNGRLDALDDRLYAAHLRNGRLWTAHNIATLATGVSAGSGATRRNAVRWYELGTLSTTPTLIQSGTIFDSAATNPNFYFIPSVMVSGQGHAAFGFSMAGLALTPNAGTVGRLSADASGTVQTPVINYSASTDTYNPPSDAGGSGGRRWGDYSYTSVDPCDDMTMWTIQEFATTGNLYGVRAVRLLAPAPIASNCPSSTDVQQGASAVAIALGGTGFFEPDAAVGACRILLAGGISGSGLSVDSVTYNSPTSLTVNISATAGATIGARDITITNPDGQTSVATGCINVTAAASANINTLNANSANVCAGASNTWQSTFSQSVTGVSTSNFALNGGTGATVNSVSGSGVTRAVSVSVGSAAGPLRLDLVNDTGITPAIAGLPFNGQTINVIANPTAFSMSGGGAYCAGSSAPSVGLSSSEIGVNYQLNRGGNPVGSPVAGTGSALDFGAQATAGNYTVSAITQTASCPAIMTGSVDVSVDPVPSVNAKSPSAICTNTATNINLDSTPGGTTFNYTATNTAGSVSGFANGSFTPIVQILAGSGQVQYAVSATLASCTGVATNILQSVSDPTPAAQSLPNGVEQAAYSATLTAPGSLQTPTFVLATGGLPTGLSLATNGSISGTPTTAGVFNFTVTGADTSVASCTATQSYAIEITLDAIFANEFE